MAKRDNKNILGKDYISKQAVADMFGVKTQSVGRWILKGEISATKIGREWFLEQKDIEDYLQERKRIGVARL